MKTKEEKHMDYFYKDNYKEGMTVYLLYTGYDLCVGKYAPRKKYSITEGIISEMGKNYLKVSTEGQKIKEELISTNMGDIPKTDYLDIKAQQYGFDDYADMRNHGLVLDI